jgi:hypothetical protein
MVMVVFGWSLYNNLVSQKPEDTSRKLSRNSLFLAKGRKEGGERKVRIERKERKEAL